MVLVVAGNRSSWICRQPQVVNEQLLWFVQRDGVFQIKQQAEVLGHFQRQSEGCDWDTDLLGVYGTRQWFVGTEQKPMVSGS